VPEPTLVLLDTARAGDERALAELVPRYAPRLRRWASGRLPAWARHQEDTDDLVQEALVAAVHHLDEIRAGGFHAYLRTAILNRIRNHLRHARVRERGEADVPTPSPEPSPLEDAVGTETLERFEAALDELSPVDRELVVGHVEFGLPLEDLALLTDKPSVNATRVALQRALVRLARAMDA